MTPEIRSGARKRIILETVGVWNMRHLLARLFATGKNQLLKIGIAAKGIEILISLCPDPQTGL